jgi:TatD DNase family protein
VSELVDTHCHLHPEVFPEGVDPVVARARAAGVTRLVCIGVGGASASAAAVRLARDNPFIVATVGVHPHDAAGFDDALDQELRSLATADEVVAIGEVGLDHHYDASPRDAQDRVFAHFVALARELAKPLVIHTREAPRQTLELLSSEHARDVGGVIHCFSEDRTFARHALDLGFDISFSGIVTFKNAASVHDVARWVPADRILVETDSPYLAPVPLRGKRCEPAFVVHTAKRVAELRGMKPEDLWDITTANALRRFRFPRAAARRTV